MNNKDLTQIKSNTENLNDNAIAEKSSELNETVSNRVDINVLKSKLQETESKTFKKNVFILITLVLALGALGIYLSL